LLISLETALRAAEMAGPSAATRVAPATKARDKIDWKRMVNEWTLRFYELLSFDIEMVLKEVDTVKIIEREV
jgi:hypothetical protein